MIASPSKEKRPRISEKNRIISELPDQELKTFLYESSDEEIELDDDSDYSWGDSDSEISECGSDLEDNGETNDNNEHNRDIAPNIPAANWVSLPSSIKTIPFTGNPGLIVPVSGSHKPIDYFYLLATDEFFNLIVRETNIYAETVKSKNVLPKSRSVPWKNVTKEELRMFLGLVLHMGNIRLSRIKDYWATNRLFNIPCFRNYMGRNRFMSIMRFLHFARNPQPDEKKPDDRLYKIRPLLDFFNNRMTEIYYPTKDLSIDEPMILWRGRLIFHQYIKNKRHKYGVKMYLLTESKGPVLKLAIYTGAMDDMGRKGHAANVVFHLLEEKLNAGHSVYMDSYYNSYDLSYKLLQQNTYSTGTLRINRKENPQEVAKSQLKIGESICKYSNGILIGKWRDKREVMYISTEHDNEEIVTKNKRGQEKSKPKPIVEYNKYMSGVDRQDQMLSHYPSLRKTLRWNKKIGIHVIEVMILNAYKLFCSCTDNKKIGFYEFRLAVIGELLSVDFTRKKDIKVAENQVQHLMAKCDKSDKGKMMRKRCRQCSKTNKRSDSMFYCKTCPNLPGLCFECFEAYHIKSNISK